MQQSVRLPCQSGMNRFALIALIALAACGKHATGVPPITRAAGDTGFVGNWQLLCHEGFGTDGQPVDVQPATSLLVLGLSPTDSTFTIQQNGATVSSGTFHLDIYVRFNPVPDLPPADTFLTLNGANAGAYMIANSRVSTARDSLYLSPNTSLSPSVITYSIMGRGRQPR